MLPLLAVGLAALFAAVLHIIWLVRYGYPGDTTPRVLCFHKLSREFLLEGTWTTPYRFTAIIDRLRDRGYEFIDEARYLELLDAREKGASKYVLLTFDDGYDETIDFAHRILSVRRIPMHVFLVTDYAGRDNTWDLGLGRPPFRHLSWDRVRELSAQGVTFGSHTASHADVTTLAYDALVSDLLRSRRDIEAATGKPVRTLSYPFGRYNPRCANAARDAGFEAAFSLYPSHRNGTIDRYALRRDAVYVIDTAGLVERKLRPNVLYGLEEMKCRAINAVARLTPVLTALRPRAQRPAP